MTKPVMPLFLFARRLDIEHPGGFLVAGILIVDLPKAAKEDKRDMRLVEEIVRELTERAQSGVLGDELTVGWDGGRKPENAVNQHDHAALAAWVRHCLAVGFANPADGLLPSRHYWHPPELKEKIFNPFFTTKPAREVTGFLHRARKPLSAQSVSTDQGHAPSLGGSPARKRRNGQDHVEGDAHAAFDQLMSMAEELRHQANINRWPRHLPRSSATRRTRS